MAKEVTGHGSMGPKCVELRRIAARVRQEVFGVEKVRTDRRKLTNSAYSFALRLASDWSNMLKADVSSTIATTC